MATAKKTASGSWEITVFIGVNPATGKKTYKHLTAPTKAKLHEKVKALEGETPQTISVLSLTVREAVDQYIARREKDLSPSTLQDYQKHARSAFPELMNRTIGELTDEICQRSIDAYAQTAAPKTVVNRWNLVHAAVKEAKRNAKLYVRLPSVKRKRLDMPEQESLFRLFKEIENTPLEIPVLLAATCGLRRSEICALDFAEDIDYQKGLIHIDKALVPGPDNRYVIKDTKTTAGERTVPCPAWVLDKLAQARDNPNYQPYKPNTITTSFAPLAKQCGVNCTFHGLRHYYASVMSALNIPEQYQMERMGHATNHMLKRYQEYLKSKEAEVNSDLMTALDNLNPSANNNQ
jgi:integrase